MGHEIAGNIINVILTRKNTQKLDVYFHFNLIQADTDDNKFVDCAIMANARYIVTQDHHFDVLHSIDFPKVDVIGIEEFLKILEIESSVKYYPLQEEETGDEFVNEPPACL